MQSANPTHNSACTESCGYQASARTEAGEAIEITSRTEAVALGETVIRSALTQAGALIKTWNFQAVSRTEAQASLVRWWKAGRLARWTGEDARPSTEA